MSLCDVTHGVQSAAVPPDFFPDMAALARIAAGVPAASLSDARAILGRAGHPLPLDELACLLKAVLAGDLEIIREISAASARLRRDLFGPWVVAMAPVEIANTCASDCLFCGWRRSNRAMKRLALPSDLVMLQVRYLLGLGIRHIEFVSGDDFASVREVLPEVVRATSDIFRREGLDGRISFCTLALTERQYGSLRADGADAMIVWQETYDRAAFGRLIPRGPKAAGIGEDWSLASGGDGCAFRAGSQDRAMRAGLQVALGAMLGLAPGIVAEFLATVAHARHLAARGGTDALRPIIVGMPIWNPITTHETDLRPDGAPDLAKAFTAVAALYLLALPSRATWVFPNCRVPMETQIEACAVAGAFTSTEVKLGPGGYLPGIVAQLEAGGKTAEAARLRTRVRQLLRDAGAGDDSQLAREIDEREQFIHHYHRHADYARAIAAAGLRLAPGPVVPAAAIGQPNR